MKVETKKPADAAGPGRPLGKDVEPTAVPDFEPTVEDVLNDEEFAKQLQAGMADLLGELEKSASRPLPPQPRKSELTP